MATLACAFGFAQKAGASVTIDLIWDDNASATLTIDPGDTAGGGSRTMGVIITSTTRLVAASHSISYPTAHGLAVTAAVQWAGYKISKGVSFLPIGSPILNGGNISSFSSVVGPPFAPPSAPPGTYRLGTVVWDTSGTSPGLDTILTYLAGPDGYANGDGNRIDGVVTFNSATLNIIPEPGTASLLGLGLVGLILAGRRRR